LSETPARVSPAVHSVRGKSGRGDLLWTVLGVMAFVLVVVGMSGAITGSLKRQEFKVFAQREAESRVNLIAKALAPTFDDRQAEAQRFLREAALDRQFTRCRVFLPDGSIFAEAAASVSPPSSLGFVPLHLSASASVSLPDDYKARVELESEAHLPLLVQYEAQGAMIIIAAVGLLGLGAAFTRLRARLRGFAAIRSALLAVGRGEQASAALAVNSRYGTEAAAWNSLLQEREKLRQELLQERARDSVLSRGDRRSDLVQVCDALWQGMILVDEQFRIKYANGAAAVFLRANREALSAGRITDFITDDRVLDAIRSIAVGDVRRRTTHEVQNPEGQGAGILRFSIRPVRRDDAAAALIIIEDITQQRVADEARNTFIAQVTHELRTPLTNIRLYVEQAIEEGEADPAAVAQALNVINKETRRLERIVGDMLSVSEIETGSFRLHTGEVRLEALFEELHAEYMAAAESKNITLAFHLPPKFPTITGDRDKIVLALHNLIGNAIKYTPESGSVDIRVEIDDTRMIIDVVDTGIGIAEEEAELIFERFYRARDKRVSVITGTGLGLALAREVVRLHGGDISVRSQIDRGSTFRVNMPLVGMAA
jgi:signal transduction histidine kinase